MHLAWGALGWILMLIMAVSLQVIPMFHVTRAYPPWLARYFPGLLFAVLLALTLANSLGLSLLPYFSALGVIVTGYSLVTVHLLWSRKRKKTDTTIWFWYLAHGSLLLALLFLVFQEIAASYFALSLEVIAGVLFVYGFLLSAIMGMLQKITPFLTWLNLQQQWIRDTRKPMPLRNMMDLLPRRKSRTQFYLHLTTLCFLLSALPGTSEILLRLAAGIMAADFLYLFFCIFSIALNYRKYSRQLLSG